MIRFSIITVCLNAGDDLAYTVQNLLNQDFGSYEIIVKDGGSNDGSLKGLPEDSKLKIFQEKDKNVYDAMNQAIKYAVGEFCIFINAGDGLYSASTLSEINAYMENCTADFYYGKSYTVSEEVTNYAPDKIDKFFCFRTTMCHQAMVIRTSYLKERGYDISYRISADREWMVYAFIQAKMKFKRIPIYISLYKGGGISSGDAILNDIKEEAKQINSTHFTKMEIVKYSILRQLTLPGIRSVISRNPRFRKVYYSMRYKLLNRGKK